ncbi:hypothetical protein N7535_006284 [Penicillium sp. DV-2018c]|nr:hypothetical protein N7461_007638 [Penicillium sp. DV-2018c]KAJ5566978.1 hypothetical protein N7535_006284 [Penicillium sp. DV-2018c]
MAPIFNHPPPWVPSCHLTVDPVRLSQLPVNQDAPDLIASQDQPIESEDPPASDQQEPPEQDDLDPEYVAAPDLEGGLDEALLRNIDLAAGPPPGIAPSLPRHVTLPSIRATPNL